MNTPSASPAKEKPTSEQRFYSFASLKWYEEVIKFVFTFAAKTSELLLAAGLTVSTVNFLTDGNIIARDPNLTIVWAWIQALAIDSSLGVTFYYVFVSVKERDWIKVVCYSLLTGLLAIVAGAITNVDTFSHAIHTTIAHAITLAGLDVKTLTTMRSIAVVGFVLMSRLKDVHFNNLYTITTPLPSSRTQEETEKTTTLIRELVIETLAQRENVSTAAQQENLSLLTSQRAEEPLLQTSAIAIVLSEEERLGKLDFLEQEEVPDDRDSKIASAYQELEAQGKRVSGRALATQAHIRRSTCNQWLAAHHPEVKNDESEENTVYDYQEREDEQ